MWRLPGFPRQVLSLALLFLLAGIATAQSPAAPKSKRERQLLERVEGVYKLFVSGEWRKVESFVSEDTRDLWFGQAKSTIDSFEIKEVTIAPDGKRAAVTVMATFYVPQANAPFTMPQKSEWVYEKGKWFLKVKKPVPITDLFKSNTVPSEPRPAQSPLVFDQNPLQIPSSEADAERVVKVLFQNVTPNVVTVIDLGTNCPCLKAETDITLIQPEQKGILTVTYYPAASPIPLPRLAVQATLAPSMYLLDLPVELKNE